MKPNRRRFPGLLLALASAVIALIILEAGLRISGLRRDPEFFQRISLPVQKIPLGYARSLQKAERAISFHRNRALEYHISRAGFRGRGKETFSEIARSPSPKVVALGGSFVFDVGQSEGESWPELLEQGLRGSKEPYPILLNGGVPGSMLSDLVGRLLYEIPEANPQVVILASLWNDLQLLHTDAPYSMLKPVPDSTNQLISYNGALDDALGHLSYLYGWIRYLFLRNSPRNSSVYRITPMETPGLTSATLRSEPSEAALRQYRRLWVSAIHLIRQINAIPIVLIEPNVLMRDPARTLKSRDHEERFTRAGIVKAVQAARDVQRSLATEGAIVLEYPLLDDPALLMDHVHLNQAGATRLANALKQDLKKAVHSSARR